MNKSAMTTCTEAYHVDKNQRREKTANEKRQHDQKSFGYFLLPFDCSHLGVILANSLAIVESVPIIYLTSEIFEHFSIGEAQYRKCSYYSRITEKEAIVQVADLKVKEWRSS